MNKEIIKNIINDIDYKIKPSDNFYAYAIGNWYKKTRIPNDMSTYSSFSILRQQNEDFFKKMINNKLSTKYTNLYILYQSGMNMKRRNIDNIQPIKKIVDDIINMKDPIEIIGKLHRMSIDVFFYLGVDLDLTKEKINIINFEHPVVGLPSIEYYKSSKYSKIRNKYVIHIANMFKILNKYYELPRIDFIPIAKKVVNLEKKLMEHSIDIEDKNDPNISYNKMEYHELKKKIPNINWDKYFHIVNIPNVQNVVVDYPKYYLCMGEILHEHEDVKYYILWQLLTTISACLSEDFYKENFQFFGKIINGRKKERKLNQVVMYHIDVLLSELVSELYIAKFFNKKIRKDVLRIAECVRDAYRNDIMQSEINSERVKKQLIGKLDNMKFNIAYPNKVHDYSKVKIDTEFPYIINILKIYEYRYNEMLNKIGKQNNDKYWNGLYAHTVNAFYSPDTNELIIPAGILQYPFYEFKSSDIFKFGGIGTVIGHEIGHAFDANNIKFDKYGVVSEWLDPEYKTFYEKKAKQIIEMFNEFKYNSELKVKGELTKGENIAELLGIVSSLEALKTCGKHKRISNEFTNEQLFFLIYVQTMKSKNSPEYMRKRILSDSHAPAIFRVNGSLMNIDEFYEAFGVTSKDNMYRKKRVHFW